MPQPADSRTPKRKRKRRPREQPEPHYRNPLTLLHMLGSVFLFMPVLYAPILFPVVNRFPRWTPVLVLLGYLAVFATLAMRSAFLMHWYVGRDYLRCLQNGPGGASTTHVFENRDFVSLAARGPFVIVRRATGERYVWPRWLRSKGMTYRWELLEGRVCLRGPDGLARV